MARFENDDLHYYIKLRQFEGPFDLLLFFIERDELDIYDIPIAKVTTDFLNYVRAMESLNIDLASDFILMCAQLMRIKTRMLLPRHQQVEDDASGSDPRMELAQRLVEYKKIKEVVEVLKDKEVYRQQRKERGNSGAELSEISQRILVESEWESISVYGLFQAFQLVLTKMKDREREVVTHRIFDFEYNVQDQRVFVLRQLADHGQLSFESIFLHMHQRIEAIVTFLAILEMLNEKLITLQNSKEVNQFWIALGRDKDTEEE